MKKTCSKIDLGDSGLFTAQTLARELVPHLIYQVGKTIKLKILKEIILCNQTLEDGFCAI